MVFTKESAADRAKQDLAERSGISKDDIVVTDIADKDFPDSSLGAAVGDEMSAQMISSGWQITLAAKNDNYEYRADKFQLRLYNFEGRNYVIE